MLTWIITYPPLSMVMQFYLPIETMGCFFIARRGACRYIWLGGQNDKELGRRALHRMLDRRHRWRGSTVLQASILGATDGEHRHRPAVRGLLSEIHKEPVSFPSRATPRVEKAHEEMNEARSGVASYRLAYRSDNGLASRMPCSKWTETSLSRRFLRYLKDALLVSVSSWQHVS
jgi:hypothetical protein